MHVRRKRRRGFTVYTLLILLVILGFLAGLLIPLARWMQESARQMESANNMKQMTLALHSCNDAYKKLPPAVGWYPLPERRNRGWVRPAGHGTIFYHILPFIEQANVYRSTSGSSWNSFGTVIKTYVAPNDPTVPKDGLHHHNRGAISYGPNAFALMNADQFTDHGFGPLGYSGRSKIADSHTSLPRITVQDGTSNTIAFAERFAACWTPVVAGNGRITGYRKFERVWGESSQGYNNFSPAVFRPLVGKFPKHVPPELMPQFGAELKSCEPATWQSFANSSIQVSLFDGSVRTVAPHISRSTWSNALRPNDGMVLGADW